jgi:hypothetical protein
MTTHGGLLGIAMLIACSLSASAQSTAAQIDNRITRYGAERTLWAIYADDDQWSNLLAQIARGEEPWLRVANRLRKVTDAGASEQLDLAVGEALEHAPERVLRLSVPVFGVGEVCGGPDMDDARYGSYELSIRAIDRREAQLRSVTVPHLRAVRDKCVASLEASKSAVARFYGVPRVTPN